VIRLLRLALLISLAAACAAPSALAGQRMWLGFQDDASLRFRADREFMVERAKNANATMVTASVEWSRVAPSRPGRAANPFDPAYRLENIDELVREAQARGLEVMLRISSTPSWAGPAPNRLPRRLSDLTAFTTALAARYSGRFPGYPFVRFYAVWNEPNLNQFLSPQFDRRGKSVAPRNYARLYAAAYTGIKRGNRAALVGMGETSARGRDRRVRGLQDTHSPGRFLQLVAQANPRLRFDAVSHHPYPTDPRQRPEQIVRWPNVSLRSIPRLRSSLQRWFRRSNVRIWITEYGHETIPDRRGVSYATQADYLRRALGMARAQAYTDMFIWFGLHDDQGNPWQSGLIAEDETVKPSYYLFAQLAYPLDARNAIVVVQGGRANPVIRLSALEIASESPTGARIGVDLRVVQGDSLVANPKPETPMRSDGWVTVPVAFTPVAGRVYYVYATLNDIHGNKVQRLLTLVARG
jgi:Cellulase (glycosyl hydrolase family 5)